MEKLFVKRSHGGTQPLYCCWHGSHLYVKVSKESPHYVIRFEGCDRVNRGWTYLHLYDYKEGLIGTKKIFKLVVKYADDADSAPFLIIAEKLTRGTFDPKPTDNDQH